MFQGFANVWTPVVTARKLGRRPLAMKVAGERVVFFRGPGGKAAALLDRCPHRGVRLSDGRVTEEGCLECPFHAWQFDGEGRARHVPLNPDAKLEHLSATALPCREIGGLLWLYTGFPSPETGEPQVPDSLVMKGAFTYAERTWPVHWTRAMENMLDSPHVPFVHRETIGRFVRPRLKPGSRMEITWEDTAWGGRTRSSIDDDALDGSYLDFYRPNMMVLNIPIPGKVFRMHAICVPVDARTVRMVVVGARNFATFPLLNPFFGYSNRKVLLEDEAVLLGSDPPEVPPASSEHSVRTDKATLRFRKYYFEVLKDSSAAPPTVRSPDNLPLAH